MSAGSTVSAQNDQTHSCFVMVPLTCPKSGKLMQSKILCSLPILVRDAREADTASIQKIYAHYVLNALATFEEVPPTLEDMCSRRQIIQGAGLPYLVAEVDEHIVGYVYATVYRPRPAYRHTVEDSV